MSRKLWWFVIDVERTGDVDKIFRRFGRNKHSDQDTKMERSLMTPTLPEFQSVWRASDDLDADDGCVNTLKNALGLPVSDWQRTDLQP